MDALAYLIFVLVMVILPIATFVGTIYVVAYFREIDIDPKDLGLTFLMRWFKKQPINKV